MAGTAMLQLIEEKMYDYIRGMQGYPYNYAWGTVNQRDMAKALFPMAVIYFDIETNVDDRNGAWAGAYYNEAMFRIEVRAQHDTERENPVWEIRSVLYKCLDDLKALFGLNWNLDRQCDTIMYTGSEVVEERAGDIMIPSKLITRWMVRYEQDRVTPTQVVQ